MKDLRDLKDLTIHNVQLISGDGIFSVLNPQLAMRELPFWFCGAYSSTLAREVTELVRPVR